jgi:hypothetical protein
MDIYSSILSLKCMKPAFVRASSKMLRAYALHPTRISSPFVTSESCTATIGDLYVSLWVASSYGYPAIEKPLHFPQSEQDYRMATIPIH